MKIFKQIIRAIAIASLALGGTSALAVTDLSSSDQTAKVYAVTSSWNANLRIEKVDDQKTKVWGKKPALVDAGERVLDLRMEYQPAAGSAILVGSIANLVLRGLTNKTFRTQISVNMASDHEYAVMAEKSDDGFDLVTFDLTEEQEIARHSFGKKDGKYERLF